MSESISRISKNTVFLYIRMIALMAITLYTSRVLLYVLGIDDFGVFSVVGSVTATFYSLRSVFAEAVQRFLNYEKGSNNKDGEIQVFSIALLLHIIIAIVFVILAESVGTWLLYNKLVIAPDRFSAACFVFHLTVLTSAISILIIPYDAVIIANEKMNVYAWVSIFDGIVKLLIVLALPYINADLLKSYSLLLAIVPMVNLFFYCVYCRRFSECHYIFSFKKDKLKEICSFSGWSFFGNLFYTIAHEGLNVIINMFGGVAYNASRNIAYQIRSAVNQVSNNTLLATKPFVLQNAALADGGVLLSYVVRILRANYYIMLISCVPLIAFCQQFLSLWLVEVPKNAVIITQLIIISVLIRCMHGPINLFYMGVGKIKRMVIIESIIFAIFLITCYIQLLFGLTVWSVFVTLCIFETIIVLLLSINIELELYVKVRTLFVHGIIPCLVITAIVLPISLLSISVISNLLFRFVVVIVINLIAIAIIMNKEEKALLVKQYIKIKELCKS